MAGTGEVSTHRRGWIRERETRQDGGGGGGGRFLVFHFLSSYITLCSTRHQINNGPTYPILSWTSSCCARPPRGVYRPSSSPPFPLSFLSTRVCDASSLFPPPPLPSDRMEAYPPKTFSRSVVQGERDRFESNRYISMMTDQSVIPSPPSPSSSSSGETKDMETKGIPFFFVGIWRKDFFVFNRNQR